MSGRVGQVCDDDLLRDDDDVGDGDEGRQDGESSA